MADNHAVLLTINNRFHISVKNDIRKMFTGFLANKYKLRLKSRFRNGSSAQLLVLPYVKLKWNDNVLPCRLGSKYII